MAQTIWSGKLTEMVRDEYEFDASIIMDDEDKPHVARRVGAIGIEEVAVDRITQRSLLAALVGVMKPSYRR